MSVNIDRLAISHQTSNTSRIDQHLDNTKITSTLSFRKKSIACLTHVPFSQSPSVIESYLNHHQISKEAASFLDSLARRYTVLNAAEPVKNTPLQNHQIQTSKSN